MYVYDHSRRIYNVFNINLSYVLRHTSEMLIFTITLFFLLLLFTYQLNIYVYQPLARLYLNYTRCEKRAVQKEKYKFPVFDTCEKSLSYIIQMCMILDIIANLLRTYSSLHFLLNLSVTSKP